ncbi:MAG: hypothetical protein ACFNOP_06385, partial [Bacteroides sp.]
IVVATPGRLLQYIKEENFDCRAVEMLKAPTASRSSPGLPSGAIWHWGDFSLPLPRRISRVKDSGARGERGACVREERQWMKSKFSL